MGMYGQEAGVLVVLAVVGAEVEVIVSFYPTDFNGCSDIVFTHGI